jgi:hypothetical protein
MCEKVVCWFEVSKALPIIQSLPGWLMDGYTLDIIDECLVLREK